LNKILVTSALPYANGPLHLGHIAGAYLPADIYVRYQRLKNRDVLYICGSDEHGVPITVSADKEGVTPQDIVDRYHAMNKAAFAQFGISFDNYSRTSLKVHHETAQEFFQIFHQNEDLIVKSDTQFYSEKTKQFLPDRYVEGTCPHCQYDKARGDQCDQCGKWLEPKELINPTSKLDGSTPVLKKTKHWYLPMGRFAEDWKVWFDSQSWKENVRNYCLGWFQEGLGDRPITRDLKWGIPVPLEGVEGKVLYVWFDAPIGYISSTKEWAEQKGSPDLWKDYWCDTDTKLVHFIGKDNIVFHAILFPMMLKRAGGYVLPSAIPANEYLTIEGRKISTSQNYAIWLKDYLESFPPDPLRYSLAANAPETKDTDFSWKQFQSRNNDELADILGNLVNRTLTFIHRYFDGKIPPQNALSTLDKEMLKVLMDAPSKVGALIESFEVRKASMTLMDVCRAANKYFNNAEPWATRKSDADRCATTLNICAQTLKTLAVLMAPTLPFSSVKLQKMLNIDMLPSWDDASNENLPEGHPIGEAEILFAKIEDDVIEKEIEKLKTIDSEDNSPKKPPEKKEPAQIDFDLFGQIELKTAKVLEAEAIPKTDKLLKLQIDVGGEKRQLVAGIAQYYSPEQIIGKTVVIVANLKPAKIRGVESNGMVLAVKSENGLNLLTPDGEVDSGLRVS